jgi:hypothetical protein
MGNTPTFRVCASTSAKISNSAPKATASPIMDGTAFRVSTTPQPPIGEEVSNGKEGEGISNSPSFADVLKKDSRYSPPLTKGSKSNKDHRVKEAESSNFQQSITDFLLR